ncbi:hypothetical protein N7501_001481 [Penicillium viridicatum]|nr:hypothetical protein N7501_001481 [Penicillium viridicatum]
MTALTNICGFHPSVGLTRNSVAKRPASIDEATVLDQDNREAIPTRPYRNVFKGRPCLEGQGLLLQLGQHINFDGINLHSTK